MITRFFGDTEYPFALTYETTTELERRLNCSIGELYERVRRRQFYFTDLVEIIRLGLIGGGMNPQAAMTMVDTYAKPRPLMEFGVLALEILIDIWDGIAEPTKESEE